MIAAGREREISRNEIKYSCQLNIFQKLFTLENWRYFQGAYTEDVLGIKKGFHFYFFTYVNEAKRW